MNVDRPKRAVRTGPSWRGKLRGMALALLVVGPVRLTGADGGVALPTGVMEFLDGSSLHGQLESMNPARGVGWKHAAAEQVIEFRPTRLASIIFDDAQPVTPAVAPTCRFRFHNGDELYGTLSGLDENRVALQTWFGGQLTAPRDALQLIAFYWKGFSVVYEGPSNAEGWVFSRGNKGWQYRDGGFVTSEPGIVGRNFKLPAASAVEFDLAWNGPFSLGMTLYAETTDRFDYSTSSYLFYLNAGSVSLQRLQSAVGVSSLGRAEVPALAVRNKVRLEFRCHKEDATLAMLLDGQLVHRWKDPAGFVAKGGGLVFSSQMEGPTLRVSNLRVSEWDGRFESEPATNAPVQGDVLLLANRDRVTGEVHRLQDGKVSIQTSHASLNIPLERVSRIVLAPAKASERVPGAWEVRAHVAGGGSVAFQLDRWASNEVAGTSASLGALSLNPRSIRQVQFNLGQSKLLGSGRSLAEEFQEIDE